ncbi:MAG: hypothetical protein MUQ48_06000 [Pirellulales bacterium]|nr:hypothetical protein [Pirellulales bacterium]
MKTNSVGTFLHRLYLTRLRKPASDRFLYRTILAHKPCQILELGIDSLDRTGRMIKLALSWGISHPLRYVGVDLFEARETNSSHDTSLKFSYKTLRALSTNVQLVPGTPDSVLPRMCNHLGNFDFVLVSLDAIEKTSDRSWFFFPRITLPTSIVLVEEARGSSRSWKILSRPEIERKASAGLSKRAG